MAIHNASDLLVYTKVSAAQKQRTRVRVLSTLPIALPDGATTGTIEINNISDGTNTIYDGISTAAASSTGIAVLTAIYDVLTNVTYGYTASAQVIDGDYVYRDFDNGANGIVPTLSFSDGTATINTDGIIISIEKVGAVVEFEPTAFSTQASFSVNADLRDITNKDSNGWSESLVGLKSFEISTDALQALNPNNRVDSQIYFDKLTGRSLVNLSFSDRKRNLIQTNIIQVGVDGFAKSASLTLNPSETDPFSGNTASKLTTAASTTYQFLKYVISIARLQGKKLNWSFYIKGSGSTTQATCGLSLSSIVSSSTVTIISGPGTATASGSLYYNITGLSTSTWTRVSFSTDIINTSGYDDFSFYIYPGLYSAQDSDVVYTSSWQIEQTPNATDYQSPADITHWQGNAYVNGLSLESGVEENLTYAASFTGSGQVHLNGLSNELLQDTEFNDPTKWTVSNPTASQVSTVAAGYGKLINNSTGNSTSISASNVMTIGDYYELVYTIPAASPDSGAIQITQGWSTTDLDLSKEEGTHTIILYAGQTSLTFEAPLVTDIWISSVSLKKIL